MSMNKNMHRLFIGLALTLVVGSAAGAAFAQGADGLPPPMFHIMGPSGICADQQYIYVMAGGKIMEYGISDLTLVKTVTLPEPVPPPDAPPRGTEAPGEFPPPPPMGGPHGIWATEGYLYVLAGPAVYKYKTPGLTLATSVELPEPEIPEAAQ